MTDNLPALLPCPFCGGAPKTIERPDNIDGTEFVYAVSCYCDGYSARAHQLARCKTPGQAKAAATSAWNRRAAIAQAQSLPDVDALANFIREIDGAHRFGAGALAEKICEWLAASPAQPVQPRTRMWHDRIKDAHPNSDPQYWPNALKVEYMEQEILELRALAAQPKD